MTEKRVLFLGAFFKMAMVSLCLSSVAANSRQMDCDKQRNIDCIAFLSEYSKCVSDNKLKLLTKVYI